MSDLIETMLRNQLAIMEMRGGGSSLSAWVKSIRGKYFVTQKSFARMLNVSHRTIEAWEQGKTKPAKTAIRLLQILDDPKKFHFPEGR